MSSKYPNENLFSLLHFFPNRCSLAWHKVNLFDAEQGRSVLSFSFYLKLQPCQSRHFAKMNFFFFWFSPLHRNCPNTCTHFSELALIKGSDHYSRLPFLSSSKCAGSGKHRFLQDAANSGLNTLVLGFVFGENKRKCA